MNKDIIESKIYQMVTEKGYDSRIVPMLNMFFIAVCDRYEYTENDLDQAINNYKQNVSSINFYNIGMNNYEYSISHNELVYDREFIENINERNIENYIQVAIKSNSNFINKGKSLSNLENITKLSYCANLYDNVEDIYKNINEMLADTFSVNNKQVANIYRDVNEEMSILDRKVDDKYDYLLSASYILKTIDNRIQDIEDGKNIKENYEAIYILNLLNMKIKIFDCKIKDEKTVNGYLKLLEDFDKYRDILGISDEELNCDVRLDHGNWYINPNKMIELIEKEIKNVTNLDTYKEDEKIKSFFDRKAIIEEQSKANEVVNQNLTEEQIEEKLATLIETKKYPKEFETVLKEYFKRSVTDLKWDKETFDKKIKNLEINLNGFEYATTEIGVIACYSALIKKIQISTDIAFLNNKELASTIIHELKHVTDETQRNFNNYENGFISSNDYYSMDNSKGINELVTEATSIKLMGVNPYRDKYCTTYRMNGYEELSYATTMICSAFGITEVEFIKLADKGQAKFAEKMEEKYPGLEMTEKFDNIDKILHSMYVEKNKTDRQRNTIRICKTI